MLDNRPRTSWQFSCDSTVGKDVTSINIKSTVVSLFPRMVTFIELHKELSNCRDVQVVDISLSLQFNPKKPTRIPFTKEFLDRPGISPTSGSGVRVAVGIGMFVGVAVFVVVLVGAGVTVKVGIASCVFAMAVSTALADGVQETNIIIDIHAIIMLCFLIICPLM